MERITILVYEIEKGKIAPDRKTLETLLELAVPTMLKELKQIQGLFAYYAKWIVNFSTKIKPLTDTKSFPISNDYQQHRTKRKNPLHSFQKL